VNLTDVHIPPRDFAVVVSEILATGVSKAQLARVLNVPWSTVDNWRKGSTPVYHLCLALDIVHAHVTQSRNLVTPNT
jgi:hypothetical protein